MGPMDQGSGTVMLGVDLTPHQVVSVAREAARVELDPGARDALARSRSLVEKHVESGRAVYGLTTGFGALADAKIPTEDLTRLQHNLIRSHAAGTGGLLPTKVVRAMMFLRARTLAAGFSGVRIELVTRLIEFLNRGIHPAVPSRGSVGASGDLAQLAHIGLCLLGEGRVLTEDGTEPTSDALRREGLEPLALEAKEGLALVNGTEGMLALGLLASHDCVGLLKAADVAAAMSVEGALGTDGPFAADLMDLRPHPGQAASAENIRRVVEESGIIASHRESEHAVQDPYSMRCAPQVHGAARDAHTFCADVLGRELGSVVDNPVIFPDGRVESTGNFHGEPLAYALDFLAVGLAGLGNVSERRTSWLLGSGGARGLPPFLSPRAGLGSGYMLAQYTQAALVSECKLKAHPASLDSIPTSGAQEDHVSMGWHAGLKLRDVLEDVRVVVAIETMCAAQALDLRRPTDPAPGTAAALRAVREAIPFLEEDRDLSVDIERAAGLVREGTLVAAVEERIGGLR